MNWWTGELMNCYYGLFYGIFFFAYCIIYLLFNYAARKWACGVDIVWLRLPVYTTNVLRHCLQTISVNRWTNEPMNCCQAAYFTVSFLPTLLFLANWWTGELMNWLNVAIGQTTYFTVYFLLTLLFIAKWWPEELMNYCYSPDGLFNCIFFCLFILL